jgi:hypothetical protein
MILGKLLYKLGLPFCEHCGKHKSFDDENPELLEAGGGGTDDYIPRSIDTMTEDEKKLYLESMGF